jgi:hypothetical protein
MKSSTVKGSSSSMVPKNPSEVGRQAPEIIYRFADRWMMCFWSGGTCRSWVQIPPTPLHKDLHN